MEFFGILAAAFFVAFWLGMFFVASSARVEQRLELQRAARALGLEYRRMRWPLLAELSGRIEGLDVSVGVRFPLFACWVWSAPVRVGYWGDLLTILISNPRPLDLLLREKGPLDLWPPLTGDAAFDEDIVVFGPEPWRTAALDENARALARRVIFGLGGALLEGRILFRGAPVWSRGSFEQAIRARIAHAVELVHALRGPLVPVAERLAKNAASSDQAEVRVKNLAALIARFGRSSPAAIRAIEAARADPDPDFRLLSRPVLYTEDARDARGALSLEIEEGRGAIALAEPPSGRLSLPEVGCRNVPGA